MGRGQGASKTVGLLWVEVEGEPAPEPRPRFDSRSKRTYVPRSAHPWKHEVRRAVRAELMRAGVVSVIPIAGRPFGLGVCFRMPRPKSHYRTGRYAGELRSSAPQCHLGTPDLDNLVKAVKDALGDWDGCPALLWANDSQIDRYVGQPRKRYVEPGEKPGLTLVVVAC